MPRAIEDGSGTTNGTGCKFDKPSKAGIEDVPFRGTGRGCGITGSGSTKKGEISEDSPSSPQYTPTVRLSALIDESPWRVDPQLNIGKLVEGNAIAENVVALILTALTDTAPVDITSCANSGTHALDKTAAANNALIKQG